VLLEPQPWVFPYAKKWFHCSEYLVPSLRIVAFTDMDGTDVVQERLAQLVELEEDIFIAGFHQ
jgi:hypothetical protein